MIKNNKIKIIIIIVLILVIGGVSYYKFGDLIFPSEKLVCVKNVTSNDVNTETINTFTFKNNHLQEVESISTHKTINANGEIWLNYIKSIADFAANPNDNFEGMSTSAIEDEDGYHTIIKMDFTKLNYDNYPLDMKYKYKDTMSTVKNIMSDEGYKCK